MKKVITGIISIFIFLAVSCGILAIIGTAIKSTPSTEPVTGQVVTAPVAASVRPTATTVQPQYKLELLAANATRQYGYMIVEGQVKNVSSAKLDNVEAVVEWKDASATFVKSHSSLIEYNPIMPGQTSPFKAMTTDNPALVTYKISFKPIFGGTIPTLDARK